MTFPDVNNHVEKKQELQKQCHDKCAKMRKFSVRDKVYILSHNRESKWINGTIIKRTGPVSFIIEMSDGRTVKRHQNQMRQKYDNQTIDISEILDIPIPPITAQEPVQNDNDNSKSEVTKPTVATL